MIIDNLINGSIIKFFEKIFLKTKLEVDIFFLVIKMY